MAKPFTFHSTTYVVFPQPMLSHVTTVAVTNSHAHKETIFCTLHQPVISCKLSLW